MKDTIYRIFRLVLTAVLVVTSLVSCVDEMEVDFPNYGHSADLSLDLSFDKLVENGLGTRSGGLDAKSINSISDLHLIFYKVASTQEPDNELNTLAKYFYFSGDALQDMIVMENRNDTQDDDDFDNGDGKKPLDTDPTQCVKTTLSDIPFGIYHIYAVANMGESLENDPRIANEKSMRAIELTWVQSGNVAGENTRVFANNKMSGYFTLSSETKKPTRRRNAAPDININNPHMSIHAWLRRTTAKITVAYDGSRLNENIYIYLRSAKIVDGRNHMPLVDNNDDVLSDENKNDFFVPATSFDNITNPGGSHAVADMVTYYPAGQGSYDNFSSWPHITSGRPAFGSHEGENAMPMFCFENLQGVHGDKRQDADGNKKLDKPGDANRDKYWSTLEAGTDYMKDGVLSGTYVEVEAYYVSKSAGNIGEGNIKYRFMLGEDLESSFNVERNHHFKLTLVFNGNANDVDWHIEYAKDYGIYVPNPYYISYLYNEDLTLPIEVIGKPESKLRAKIIESNWYPEVPAGDPYWASQVYNPQNVRTGFTGSLPAVYSSSDFDGKKDGPWNGFLSLYRNKSTTYPEVGTYNGGGVVSKWIETVETASSVLMFRGYREYEKVLGTHVSHSSNADILNDSYTVTEIPDGCAFNIPFYTNPIKMLGGSGYSGNNPYYAYQRKARVELSIDISHKNDKGQTVTETVSDVVTIYQVRRVINPAGVFRSSGNSSKFKVILSWRTDMDASDFYEAESEGPWEAYIESGEGWQIMDKDGIVMDKVKGKTGTNIIFEVQPTGTIAPAAVKCAVVKVTYHNNTCVHRIMLRQGDSPLRMVPSGVYWHTYNLVYGVDNTGTTNDGGEEAGRITEEGSLFRYGNVTDAIDAINNQLPAGYITSSPIFVDDYNKNFKLAPVASDGSATTKKWREIDFAEHTSTVGFDNYKPVINSVKCSLAAFEDFNAFVGNDDFDFNFGIMYGDNASETRMDANTTFNSSWYTSVGDTGNGMRGCFVYNNKNGLNLFFPIGVSGFGHRTSWHNNYPGVRLDACLKYGQRGTKYSLCDDNPNHIAYRPLFETIYTNLGAVYWLNKLSSSQRAWDINFTTFDFAGYGSNANAAIPSSGGNPYHRDGSDACMIRLVQTSKPTGHTQTSPGSVLRHNP